ncbi:MAG: rhodanese-like domain-containing protein, partial [Ferruginibacter sp.]
KNLSKKNSSTIGNEKLTNWSLQEEDEAAFVKNLLEDQPFIPVYFSYDVELNKKGAPNMSDAISAVKKASASNLNKDFWIIDVRKEHDFKEAHLPYSLNIQEDGKFETWLGSIINPQEQFYLAAKDEEQLQKLLLRVAAIGYETAVAGTLIITQGEVKEPEPDIDAFKNHTDDYTIVDVRNKPEVAKEKIFENSISIPLAELRGRINEIPTDKPIVVHCAGGYRSAVASSMMSAKLDGAVEVFDLGDAVKEFQKEE